MMAGIGLPKASRFSAGFNAVVNRVAQHMQQWLEQGLYDQPVRFGGVALRHQTDFLIQAGRHFPDQPGEPLEHLAQRLNPRRYGSMQTDRRSA